ncbi:MAG: EamA family transporter [Euryarchaeota archaeon]|nr:EamA family transporter [Euryarchaeota archaeon]
MPESASPPVPALGAWKVPLAFLAVYVIWGSTYLGIKVAIETIPPMLMAGARFLAAGAILYAWARSRGAARPVPAHWLSASIVGGLLLLGGNGALTWAEQTVPSALAALLVAAVPIWMALLNWWWPGAQRPGKATIVGLLVGFLGVALLIDFTGASTVGQAPLFGALVILGGTLAWAMGSLYSRSARLPSDPILAIGMEMLAGGALLTMAGAGMGEFSRVDVAAISSRSLLAFLYLTTFGSIIAFTCYVWLLRVSTPAKVSTYAYVNPVIALFLGWALASEGITPRTLAAAAVIIVAVAIITTGGRTGGAKAVWRRFTTRSQNDPMAGGK